MSNAHPEDNAQSRFAAFWMIVAALAVFVLVLRLVLWASSADEHQVVDVVEDGKVENRMKILADVMKAQGILLNEPAVVDKEKNLVRIPVKDGMRLVLPVLQNKKAGPTKVLVPGSPTQLKQSQVAAPADGAKQKESTKGDAAASKTGTKTAPEASGKKEGEDKPTGKAPGTKQ